MVISEVANTADDGKNRAEVRITASPLPYNFILNAVLLVGERKADRGGLDKFINRAGHDVEADGSNHELDITVAEGCCI